MNLFKHLHPHARIWFTTVVIITLVFAFAPRTKVFVHQPQGQVIAYYTNDYQRYAIDELTKQNKLEQYPCLYELWQRESNWRPAALNKSSHALGIAQLLPNTWKILNVKPTKDGFKQVLVGLRYIDRHYGKTGGICRAYAHHLAMGWY
jgi:hypothetical protein